MQKIRFNEPYLTGNELGYIEDVFKRRHFYGNGHYTKRCHELAGAILGNPNVLLTDSCTSALEMAALLLKSADKDEVILPSYTFTSTGSAFARAGYKIQFAEIDPLTMMICLDDVERLINERTQAIVGVHYGGQPCDIVGLQALADKHNIALVEDAAQAFGAKLNGQALGTFGAFGCFSFHETKNLHAGLSGLLSINQPDLYDRAIHTWERGTNRQEVLRGVIDKYSWVEVGGSFYPTELQAAFLCAQLESYEDNTHERQVIDTTYRSGLMECKTEGKLSFVEFAEGYEPNFHAFYIMLPNIEATEALRKHLVANEIFAYIGYVPLHSSRVGLGLGYEAADLPVTEERAQCVLRLPFHNNMSSSDTERVTDCISKYLLT